MILLLGTCHLPKLKILERAASGIKETDVAGEGGGRSSEKIRNKKLGPRHTDCRFGVGRRMGLLLRERGEVGGSLVLYSWEVAADVPTRLARARCHLAAKKTVPSAPSSSLPPRDLPPVPTLGPFVAPPGFTARVHGIAATGQ